VGPRSNCPRRCSRVFLACNVGRAVGGLFATAPVLSAFISIVKSGNFVLQGKWEMSHNPNTSDLARLRSPRLSPIYHAVCSRFFDHSALDILFSESLNRGRSYRYHSHSRAGFPSLLRNLRTCGRSAG